MKFTIITLFPEFISNLEDYSIIGRAIKDKKIELNIINLRDFGLGSYKQVDDKPYGGGAGMLFRVDVLSRVISFAKKKAKKKHRVIILCPTGEKFRQKLASDYSKLDELILVCGHYEGFDHRIYQYADEIISVGDYVLSGGEIGAMAIIDSVSRLKSGVLGNPNSLNDESFNADSSDQSKTITEYPQYTRPEEFENQKVPEVLLSGDPKKIALWQKQQVK